MASHKARTLAEELGVDLHRVVPKERWGISVEDVRRHDQAAKLKSAPCAIIASSISTTARAQQRPKKRKRAEASKEHLGEAENAVLDLGEAEGDPLLLNGNCVRVKWPVDGEHALLELDGLVRWLPQRAKEGRTRVYEITFDDGDVMLTKLVGKLEFTVTESGRKPGRTWSNRESEALLLRKQARVQEADASIAVSFGRSIHSITSRYRVLSNPAYTPPSGAALGGSGHSGARVGWRGVVAKVLQEFPEQQGSLGEIYTSLEKLPELIGALDRTIYPGTKTTTKWQQRVMQCCCVHPEFCVVHSSRKAAKTVYRYNATLAPSIRTKLIKKKDTTLDYIKAFRK
ncbi:hypothetical protein CYMTET_3295 [Cymbomonas tetramitiformis]|uniref:Uncharacterized protein n=1 Tax=Cymbomonas tetramitiformis TaxID=36881 RepID=A0AAE0H3K9_9CHLO|nr:hypothetical protein CYMTET_3295 [Cymbomonas tetramitiformis]